MTEIEQYEFLLIKGQCEMKKKIKNKNRKKNFKKIKGKN